ncbi:MAG: CHAT domain-containing protein, partial [Planctomycetota bacterium]
TLANHPAPPWLVYANACKAGMESRAAAHKYQRNVFGLATAFLAQGVAAYVAPLWPIDDLLAQLIATNFYQHLLSERFTLGESLRRAKSEARRVGYPDAPAESDDDSAWASLGWASLVLYGDPTEELFQALAGSEAKSQPPTNLNLRTPIPTQDSLRANDPPIRHAGRCVHAPDRLLAEWVAGPQRLAADVEHIRRGRDGGDPVTLELIEEAGLRRWRIPTSDSTARGIRSCNDRSIGRLTGLAVRTPVSRRAPSHGPAGSPRSRPSYLALDEERLLEWLDGARQ